MAARMQSSSGLRQYTFTYLFPKSTIPFHCHFYLVQTLKSIFEGGPYTKVPIDLRSAPEYFLKSLIEYHFS